MRQLIAHGTIIAAAVALTLPAHGQQPSGTITLSCDGTSKLTATTAADLQPDPITKLGIIINMTERTVTFTDYVTPITGITSTLIRFIGRHQPAAFMGVQPAPITIDGSIDRVTGNATVSWWYEKVANNTVWELTCRPATRLF